MKKITFLRLPAGFKQKSLFMVILIGMISITSCQKDWWALVKNPGGSIPNIVSSNMVLQWNAAGMEAVRRAGFGPNGPLPPMPESRIYAILNIGLYDALNNIIVEAAPYALNTGAHPDANPDAAVAQAGHDIIASLFPPFVSYADSLLTVSLAGILPGTAKTDGIAIGQAAAAAILANRANDGVANAQTGYTPGAAPGDYRATTPYDAPPFNGFVAVPAWGNITPFVMTSGSQFRVEPEYVTTSAAYASDYNEVKALGGMSSYRTKDQTQIGLFWLENIPHQWTRIARGFIVQYNFDAWKAARCLALLEMAEADANIGSLESKFYYNFWRPQTAIPLGDHDNNPNTGGNTSWVVNAPPTPPVPDYPSNHSTNGGAASEVLQEFLGTDNINFSVTSETLPGVTRSYTNISTAEKEVYLSRIYVGYHFRHACEQGDLQGQKIGAWVMGHVAQPL